MLKTVIPEDGGSERICYMMFIQGPASYNFEETITTLR